MYCETVENLIQFMDESLKSKDYSIMVDIDKARTDKARVRNLDGEISHAM